MSELDPNYKRVTIDVPADILPELMVTLGDYAIKYDMSVAALNSPAGVSEASITVADKPNHNPALVTWTEGDDPQTKVAIITENNVVQSEVLDKFRKEFPKQVYSRLHNASFIPAGKKRDYDDSTADYFYSSPNGEQEGLITSKLPELIEKLESREISVGNIGPAAIALLNTYLRALHNQPIEQSKII